LKGINRLSLREERVMEKRFLRVGAVFVLVLGLVTLGEAASVAGAHPFIAPHIAVINNTGNPQLSGSGFTASGSVLVKQYRVGKKKPIAKFTLTAAGDGSILTFVNCDGAFQDRFLAKDLTTGKLSNKTPAVRLVCIG
jgi:hypothetical protein